MSIQMPKLNSQSTIGQTPQLVFVTDRGYLKPTLFTLWSALNHFSGPVIVHFWGDQLTENDWSEVKRVAQASPLVTLNCLALTDEDIGGRKQNDTRLTAAMLGRLRIAEKLSGRILYIDGDTHVRGDLAPLFSIDLNGHLIGAVRDFVVAKWAALDLTVTKKHSQRIAALQKLLGQNDISKYFNSGVLLIDTDAIRAEPNVYEAMRNVTAANNYELADQDHLNKVFNGRTLMLNPAFNSSWSRTRRQRNNSLSLGGSLDECTSSPDCIVHFHGTPKPWIKARKDIWKARGRAVWRYRRAQKEFQRIFPDIKF
ncbi:glycosyltransferase family 8 protein [Paenochrobactrum pullorum]|uniref:glycosyltransferase family 8 protein n=1 Tax=Paenochrobactrum pullorum TaxID=1324351 RepID=UPI0035BC3597